MFKRASGRACKVLAVLSVVLSQLPMRGAAQSEDQTPPAEVIAAAQRSFHEYDSGASLDYIISTTREPGQAVLVTRSFDPSPGFSVRPAQPVYPNPHIKRMVMDADFVGSATTLNSWSYPTAGDSFLLTIYLVHINKVSVGNGEVRPGDDIYITRAGGKTNYRGHPVLAVDTGFDLFPLSTSYVFFGTKVGSNLYKVDSNGSLEENDGVIKESNKRNAYSALYRGRDTKSVLAEAFSAWQELPLHTSEGHND